MKKVMVFLGVTLVSGLILTTAQEVKAQETAHQLGLPVFSFEGTNHDQTGKNQVFKNDQVDEMVKAVREYLETIER